MENRRWLSRMICALAVAVALAPLPSPAADTVALSRGQTIYVPAYSHIYVGNKEQPFLLTVTLSIRNVDMRHKLTVSSVDYYETQGKLVQKYLDAPVTLGPLESIRYIVPQKSRIGGSGANFIVLWRSQSDVNPPLVECVMIGAESQQGISFTSRGQVISTDN